MTKKNASDTTGHTLPLVVGEHTLQKLLTTCPLDDEQGLSKTRVIVDHGKPAGVISLPRLDRANRTASASNAAALRCGFVREGVLRKAEIIGEVVHDQDIYGHLV